MKRKNTPSILFCCKMLIYFLIVVEYESLTTSQKELYKFCFIKDAIVKGCEEFKQYVMSPTAFTRKRKWSFEHYINFIIFNERKTIRNNISTFLKDVVDGVKSYRKQSFSQQRKNINPEIFKQISLNYLKNIKYLNNKENNTFFRTFYGFRLFAGDGSLFELPDKLLTLKEFGFKSDYNKLPKVKFSGIVDVLNGFLIDGIIGKRGIGELTLIHENIKNCVDLIVPQKSIFIFDRGYNTLELMARIINMDSFFVIRLRKDSYIGEREYMTSDDEILEIELDKDRIKRFKDPILKVKFSKLDHLNLRIVNITLATGEIESLITNLPQDLMSKENLNEIYEARWGIECTYKTLKQRLQIENYTAQTEIGITQDIYSTFLMYNIFCYSRIYLNLLINNLKRKQGNQDYYDVDQSNLISRLKLDILEPILNTSKTKEFIQNIIEECTVAPNKIPKPRTYERKTKSKSRKFKSNNKPTF